MTNLPEEKRFSVISNDSIRMYAESAGLMHLSDDVIQGLAEDVTYRVREIISKSCCFTRAARRKKLKGSDVEKALFWNNIPPVSGASPDTNFIDMGGFYCPPEELVDLKDEASKMNECFVEAKSITLKRSWFGTTPLKASGKCTSY